MVVVPREVPSGPRVFVNRQPDFAWMDEFWSSAASARVGVCSGLPGVGKTAFVRRCVEQARAAGTFADGDLHIDFGPVDGEQVSVADALATCLTGLGVNKDVLPPTLAERANRLRSLTAHRSVLIVLENVTDPAQVTPFVPNSASSAVLVTSNSPLSELELDGAQVRRLAPLDGAAGAHLLGELLRAKAAAEPEAVAELVRLCGGLPVALKVAAAPLAARPALRVATVVAAINTDRTGLTPFSVGGRDTLFAVFSASYAALGPDAARLYRLLGTYPGQDATADTITELFGRDSAVAGAAISALYDAGLLEEDSAQRLSLHPLLRRHAATLADKVDSDVDRVDALRRVTRHLLRWAAWADLAVFGAKRLRYTPAAVRAGSRSPFERDAGQPNSVTATRRAALDWLEAERMNLLAVQRAAADQGWHDVSWQFAEALTAIYVTRRYYVDWTVSSEIGAGSARAAGNIAVEARLRSFVSRAWIEVGRPERAHAELFGRAVPLAESAGEDLLSASVWEFVGRYRDATDPDHARAAYTTALEFADRSGNPRATGLLSFFVAKTHVREGDLEQAEVWMRAALAKLLVEDDARMHGRCLTELGAILLARGRADEARPLFVTAADILAADGGLFYEAQALDQLLALGEREHDVPTLRSTLTRAISVHRELGSGRAEELSDALDQLPDQH